MAGNHKRAFDNIIMFAAGADPLKFLNVKAGLEGLDRAAEAGDKDSEKLLDIVMHFSNLIDILGKER